MDKLQKIVIGSCYMYMYAHTHTHIHTSRNVIVFSSDCTLFFSELIDYY